MSITGTGDFGLWALINWFKSLFQSSANMSIMYKISNCHKRADLLPELLLGAEWNVGRQPFCCCSSPSVQFRTMRPKTQVFKCAEILYSLPTAMPLCCIPTEMHPFNFTVFIWARIFEFAAFLVNHKMCSCSEDLPGFTRSVYYKDYAIITPESRVWTSLPEWWYIPNGCSSACNVGNSKLNTGFVHAGEMGPLPTWSHGQAALISPCTWPNLEQVGKHLSNLQESKSTAINRTRFRSWCGTVFDCMLATVWMNGQVRVCLGGFGISRDWRWEDCRFGGEFICVYATRFRLQVWHSVIQSTHAPIPHQMLGKTWKTESSNRDLFTQVEQDIVGILDRTPKTALPSVLFPYLLFGGFSTWFSRNAFFGQCHQYWFLQTSLSHPRLYDLFRMTSASGAGFLVYEHRYRDPHSAQDEDTVECPYNLSEITDQCQVSPRSLFTCYPDNYDQRTSSGELAGPIFPARGNWWAAHLTSTRRGVCSQETAAPNKPLQLQHPHNGLQARGTPVCQGKRILYIVRWTTLLSSPANCFFCYRKFTTINMGWCCCKGREYIDLEMTGEQRAV